MSLASQISPFVPQAYSLKPQVSKMVASVLQRPTLVLNRNWQPVNVATVARALVLLWNESARVVDPADYETVDWNDCSKLRPDNSDMFVQAMVETPVNLSDRQKELLKEFDAESAAKTHSPQAHGFFGKVRELWEDLKE